MVCVVGVAVLCRSNMWILNWEASTTLQSVALSASWEDMSPQKKQWLVTLQEVFYSVLSAVGIPHKCIKTQCQRKSCWMISYQNTQLISYHSELLTKLMNCDNTDTLSIDIQPFLGQHHHLSDHMAEELHALHVQRLLSDGHFCGWQPCFDLHCCLELSVKYHRQEPF